MQIANQLNQRLQNLIPIAFKDKIYNKLKKDDMRDRVLNREIEF